MCRHRGLRACGAAQPGQAGDRGHDPGQGEWQDNRPFPRDSGRLGDSQGALQHQQHLPGGEYPGCEPQLRDLAERYQYPAEHGDFRVAGCRDSPSK